MLLLFLLLAIASAQDCNTRWTHVTDYDDCLEAARWARGNGTFAGYEYTKSVDRIDGVKNYAYCLPEDYCYSNIPGSSNFWKWYENGDPSTVSLDGETYTFQGCYKYHGNGEQASGGSIWSTIQWIDGTIISGYNQGQFDEVVKFEDGTYGFKPECTCSTARDNGFFLVGGIMRRDERVTKELCEKYAISVGARFRVKSDAGVRGCVAYLADNVHIFAWSEDNEGNAGKACDDGGPCVYMRDKCDRCMPGYRGQDCTACGDNQYNDYVTTNTAEGLVDTTMSSYDCLIYSGTVGHKWERMINEASCLSGCFVIEHANHLNSVYFNLDNARQVCDTTYGQKCITKAVCTDCLVSDEHKIIDGCKEYTDFVLDNTGSPDGSVTQAQCLAMGGTTQTDNAYAARPSGCYMRAEDGDGLDMIYNANTNAQQYCDNTYPEDVTYCVKFDNSTRSDCPAGSRASYVLTTTGFNDNSMTLLECREYASLHNLAFQISNAAIYAKRPYGCYWRTGYEVIFNLNPAAYFTECRSGGTYINSTQCIQKKCDVCLPGYGNKGSGCELCNITEFNAVESSSNTTCNKKVCPIGFGAPKLQVWDASHVDESNDCVPCPVGEYSSSADDGQCSICSTASAGQVVESPCSPTSNAVIKTCANGQTFANGTVCSRCSPVPAGFIGEVQQCTSTSDAVYTPCPKYEDLGVCRSHDSEQISGRYLPTYAQQILLGGNIWWPGQSTATRIQICKRLCEEHPHCSHYTVYDSSFSMKYKCDGGILTSIAGYQGYIYGSYRLPPVGVLGSASNKNDCADLCAADPTCNYFDLRGVTCYKTKDCNKLLRTYVENNQCKVCSDIPAGHRETVACGVTDRETVACANDQYVEDNTCKQCLSKDSNQVIDFPCTWTSNTDLTTCSSGTYAYAGTSDFDQECKTCDKIQPGFETMSLCTTSNNTEQRQCGDNKYQATVVAGNFEVPCVDDIEKIKCQQLGMHAGLNFQDGYKTGHSTCSCKAGYGGDDCSLCPLDKYNTALNANRADCQSKSCTTEGTGIPVKSTWDATDVDASNDCDECASGKYANNNQCDPCPSGKYSGKKASQCSDCPSGFEAQTSDCKYVCDDKVYRLEGAGNTPAFALDEKGQPTNFTSEYVTRDECEAYAMKAYSEYGGDINAAYNPHGCYVYNNQDVHYNIGGIGECTDTHKCLKASCVSAGCMRSEHKNYDASATYDSSCGACKTGYEKSYTFVTTGRADKSVSLGECMQRDGWSSTVSLSFKPFGCYAYGTSVHYNTRDPPVECDVNNKCIQSRCTECGSNEYASFNQLFVEVDSGKSSNRVSEDKCNALLVRRSTGVSDSSVTRELCEKYANDMGVKYGGDRSWRGDPYGCVHWRYNSAGPMFNFNTDEGTTSCRSNTHCIVSANMTKGNYALRRDGGSKDPSMTIEDCKQYANETGREFLDFEIEQSVDGCILNNDRKVYWNPNQGTSCGGGNFPCVCNDDQTCVYKLPSGCVKNGDEYIYSENNGDCSGKYPCIEDVSLKSCTQCSHVQPGSETVTKCDGDNDVVTRECGDNSYQLSRETGNTTVWCTSLPEQKKTDDSNKVKVEHSFQLTGLSLNETLNNEEKIRKSIAIVLGVSLLDVEILEITAGARRRRLLQSNDTVTVNYRVNIARGEDDEGKDRVKTLTDKLRSTFSTELASILSDDLNLDISIEPNEPVVIKPPCESPKKIIDGVCQEAPDNLVWLWWTLGVLGGIGLVVALYFAFLKKPKGTTLEVPSGATLGYLRVRRIDF